VGVPCSKRSLGISSTRTKTQLLMRQIHNAHAGGTGEGWGEREGRVRLEERESALDGVIAEQDMIKREVG
jgi:hypothetical protein